MNSNPYISLFARIRVLINAPLCIGHIILYLCSKNKSLIDSDINAWSKYRNFVDSRNKIKSLIRLIVIQPEFRVQFNLRIGRCSNMLIFFNRGGFADLGQCPNIGSGFVLMHGFGTVINGSTIIGKNCTVLHNVTIGAGRGGTPHIGNNVYIGAGAIIIGNTHIGNNVKIGAGAIVVNDVPDNCTIVPEKSRIINTTHNK